MSRKLYLFPFGGNAREALLSVLAVNALRQEWSVAGFLDDDPNQHGKEYLGVPVVGGREVLAEQADALVLAVPGSPSSHLRRRSIIESLPVDRSRFATIIHPSVERAPDADIGCNTVVMPNTVISCSVRIGDHCVLLPNSVISHDSIVGDHCCIGSNVSISGSVHIGAECYIGSGVKVREHIRIGRRCLVGLGSSVIADIESDTVAAGSPARTITRYPSEASRSVGSGPPSESADNLSIPLPRRE